MREWTALAIVEDAFHCNGSPYGINCRGSSTSSKTGAEHGTGHSDTYESLSPLRYKAPGVKDPSIFVLLLFVKVGLQQLD